MTQPYPSDVTDVKVITGTVVQLTFSDNFIRVFDIKPLMRGPVFDEIFEKNIFKTVRVDKEMGTIVWDNGADIAPEVLRGEW